MAKKESKIIPSERLIIEEVCPSIILSFANTYKTINANKLRGISFERVFV